MRHLSWARADYCLGFGMGAVILVVLWLFNFAGLPPAQAQENNFTAAHIQAVGRLSKSDGWLWLDERLYRTTDTGHSWVEITPPLSKDERLAAVSFNSTEDIWALLFGETREGENSLQLAHTWNGGQNWYTVPIPLAEEDRTSPTAQFYLTTWGTDSLWVVQKYLSSANFSVGYLYRSGDGGRSWQRLALPIAEPIRAESASEVWLQGGARGDEHYRSTDGGNTWMRVPQAATQLFGEGSEQTSARQMVSELYSWKLERRGNCESRSSNPPRLSGSEEEIRCVSTERLWSTEDGGQTWTRVTLPNGKSALESEQVISSAVSRANVAFHMQGENDPETLLIATLQGHAFDKCEVPPLDKLSVWRAQSPYRALNLYIGGIHRACNNAALSPEFIAQLRQQGWGLIPTWVGPQARCTNYRYRMSKYPPKAYQEGRSEAEMATLAAQQLGLTNSSGNGSVIYYDLEHYDVGNEECNLAAQAFVNGWVERMNELGMIGGIYSTGRPLSQFAALPNPPPVIWAAHWIYRTYQSEANVWDVFGLSNELWNNRQRLRQYAGGHDETWGEVKLTIDSNVMDGVVSYHFYLPEGLDYQTYFPLIFR